MNWMTHYFKGYCIGFIANGLIIEAISVYFTDNYVPLFTVKILGIFTLTYWIVVMLVNFFSYLESQ
jgi:hypothetical protein